MNSLLAIAALALGVSIAYFIPGDGGPAVLVCAVSGLVAALLIKRSEGSALLLQVFIAALLVRLITATIIYFFEMQDFFGGDALTYDDIGYWLVQRWRGEMEDDIYREFLLPRLSRNGGMNYLTAVIYVVTGRNMLAVQFFNAVIGAATSVVIYHCAHHIFRNRRVARLSLIFVAFWPSLVLWSAQGLKDGPIMFLLAVTFLTFLKLEEGLRVSRCVVLACALVGLLSLRFYIFYIVIASIVGAYILGFRASMSQNLLRQFVAITLVGVGLAFVSVTRSAGSDIEVLSSLETVQQSRADQARFNSGYGKDLDVSTTSGAIGIIPLGTAYLLFAPFPWELTNFRQAITLPEMLAWWGCFPILIIGLWYAFKFKFRQSLPILLFTSMLTLAYAIFQANVGTAYRQRSQLMEFYFIFVSVGVVLLRERKENRERLRIIEARRLAAKAHTLRCSRPHDA
jgi:4-amino-4-deoxy-L-arabinose transferase-like glycosyltransferase